MKITGRRCVRASRRVGRKRGHDPLRHGKMIMNFYWRECSVKRVLTTAVVTSAAVGMLLAGAGTASAQDPYAKYPTESLCRTEGLQYVLSGKAYRYDCSGPHAGPASQKWWLYLI